MPQILSVTLEDEQMERLLKVAEQLGKTPTETTTLFIQERLREDEFPAIEFRSSLSGRQPYVRGTRLPVWQIVLLADAYDGDAEATARHLHCPVENVRQALRYANAYPGEIDAATAEGSANYEELKAILPDLELLELPE